MARKIAVRDDAALKPQLRDTLQSLRGCMAEAAECQPLPERFTAESDPNGPRMIITDTTTGRQATVALYAYRATRATLTELFAPI